MEGVDLDFDLGIEHDDNGPSDGARYRFALYADNTLWRHLIMKRDLQLEYLKRYLQLKDFDFMVCDKNDARIFIEPEAK